MILQNSPVKGERGDIMLHFTSGNLLESKAEALVNTVNCEGFMGKGLAYQFKLAFPETNKSYIMACKLGTLRLGVMHSFRENGKLIINFPTKGKWRSKSNILDIESGLDALVKLLIQEKPASVAIPPLGCGNGGLKWNEIRQLLESKLDALSESMDIYVYEPTLNMVNYSVAEPSLELDAYILMLIKEHLDNSNETNLYYAVSLINCLQNQGLFQNKSSKTVSKKLLGAEVKKIAAFQKHFSCKDTREARLILYNKIVSKKTISGLAKLEPILTKVCSFINSVQDERQLEASVKFCKLLVVADNLSEELNQDVNFVEALIRNDIVEANLWGYSLTKA